MKATTISTKKFELSFSKSKGILSYSTSSNQYKFNPLNIKLVLMLIIFFMSEYRTMASTVHKETQKSNQSSQRFKSSEVEEYHPEGEETYLRKKQQLLQFQAQQDISQMQQESIDPKVRQEKKKVISDEELVNNDSGQTIPRAYLSTTFYKNKNFFIESQLLTKEEKILLPFSGLQFGDPQGNPNALPGQGQNSNEFSRDNSYLNFAFNIKTSYELPVDKLDKIEQRQIIESFLDKKAKTHASQNFIKLQKAFGTNKTTNVQNFSKLCYTQESPKHIYNITGGILPQKIQTLPKTEASYKFFNKDLQINCTSKWKFEQLEILVSRSDQMEIVNMNPKASIKIQDILSTSPELEIYYESKVAFPYQLNPGEKMTMQLVLTPETYGMFQAAVFILFDNYIFVEPISGEVSQNVYKLEPTYVTDVLVNESLTFSFDVYNHKSNEDLIIRNLYPSVEYFQSYWPNGVKVEDKLDFEKLNDTFVSQFLKVKPQGTKHIMNFNFQVDQPGDYQTAIVMITSFGDFMQIPFYFHVHTDPIKFYPTIVDFGAVERNFDLVKVSLRLKVKNVNDNFTIQDIFVPIDDERLDFLMTNSIKLNQDKKPLKKGNDLTPLGSVILNPTANGLIDSKIIIILSQYSLSSNSTLRIEIPIIGYITSDPMLVIGNSTQTKRTHTAVSENGRQSSQQPNPLAKFDVSPYMVNDSVNLVLFKVPQFLQEKLYSAFYFTNNFNYPIFLKDIINFNPEITIDIVPEIKHKLDNSNEGMIIHPDQSIRLAWIELKTQPLKISSGNKFIAIQVNDTIMPLAIAIYDRNLLCVWEEDYSQIRYTQCKQGYDINYGSMATNEPKYRKVNITNMNPMEIVIDSIDKPQDDMVIYVEKVYYKSQKIAEYTYSEGLPENATSQFILSGDYNKRKSNAKLRIGRYETYTIVFMVKAKEVKQMGSHIIFMASGSINNGFSFNYNYQIIEGQLTLMPYQLYYDPAFPGILQHKTITAKSTFDVPIVIKQIICSDPRIQPKLVNTVIMPKNKSELAILTFDPSKTAMSAIIPQMQQLQPQGNGATPQMNPQVFNFMNGAHVIIQNNQANGGGIGLQNMMKQALNTQELFQWREKQKSWEKQGSLGKTEIQAKVTIETNIFQNIEIPVKAYLTRPQIVVSPEDDILNFELVQIGTQVMKNIKIYNPSDEPLTVQLYLATEEYFKIEAQINEQAEKQSTYEKEFYRVMHNGINSKRMKGQNKGDGDVSQSEETLNSSQNGLLDSDNGFEKECYISMYCASKLKDNLTYDETIVFDELLVNSKMNIEQLCLQLLYMIDDKSQEGTNLDDNLIKNLEPFFKELYINEQGGGNNQGNGDQINLSQLLQNGNQFQWDKQQQQFGGGAGMSQQMQSELKLQVDEIHTLTMASQLDNLVKGLQKMTQRSIFELAYYGGIMEQIKQLIRVIFYDNYPGTSQSVVPYKLKNDYLQDLLINNGSTFKAQHQSILSDHQYSPELIHQNTQSFFINPKIQNKYYTIDPKRNLTISDAVIFYPQSIRQQHSQMTLLIRNNLTILYPLELRGSGGTGIIEFIKVIKKASNETSQIQDLLMNEKFNSSYVLNTSSPEVRENIIQFIYGETENEDTSNQGKKGGFNKQQHVNNKKEQQDSEKVILFSISIEDLLQFDQEVQHEIFTNYDSQQFSQLDLLLSDKSHQIRVNNYHKRILIAKNTGNMPVTINNILVEGKKCQANGLVVENCHAFNLLPGDTHQIHLSYITDFSLAKIKKTLTLESQHFSLVYVVQVQIPIRFLSLAHQMVPLNQVEESLYISMTIAIIVVGSAILFFGFKGVVAHIKYSKDLFEHNQKQTILETLKEKKKGEPKFFVKRGDIGVPIIKDAIGSESITNQYQFVMEKFENQNSLFLKEISNICGKKNMIILDAQRQAQEAEKERNKQNRMNLQKYFEKKNKEDQSSSYIQELQASYQPILSENQRFREQRAKEIQDRDHKLQTNYAKEEEKKQNEFKKIMSQSEQASAMAPLVLEKCSRSNTIDSAAALNTSSLDQSREGKQSDDKVSINDESIGKGGKQQQQVQQKKKNQTKQNKKQIQRREEILKQQELQNQREQQQQLQSQREQEIYQRAQQRKQFEDNKAIVSKVSVLEIEEEEKASFQQKRSEEKQESVSKREQPCNEQVATDQKYNQVRKLSSSENIEEEPLIEIYDQAESLESRANVPIIELDQSQIEQKGISEFERQEDLNQEQQIMHIIEDPRQQQDDVVRAESDVQNDSYDASTSLKKEEDLSIEIILPSTPKNLQQIKNESKDSGEGTHESKKQNSQEQIEQHQIPTNSQLQQQHQTQYGKKIYPIQIVGGQAGNYGVGYQSKKGYRDQPTRTVPPQQQPIYQKFRPVGTGSIPATNVSHQQVYYQKRGQSGPGVHHQSRGSSSNYAYNLKRPGGGWIKGSSNYYQEEETPRTNQFTPTQQYQAQQSVTPQFSNTPIAPIGSGPKRIVTNSLKNAAPQQPAKYSKGRGTSTSSYYTSKNMNNADFDDEYYEQQQSYYNTFKRSRDEYDEDSYIDYNSGTNTYSNTNKFYAKKNNNMSKYQQDGSERREGAGTNRIGQDEEDYGNEEDVYQEDQRPSKDNSISSNKYVKEFAYQKSDKSQNRGGSIGDDQYIQSQNDEGGSSTKGKNMLNQFSSISNRESQAKTQKLSKNELEPFFESKNKEKQYQQQQHQSEQNANISTTMKPFTQFNQLQSQMKMNEEESKQGTPQLYSKDTLSDQNYTDSEADNKNSSQTREIDFFNVFNQVNSVFQYGCFGRPNQEHNEEDQQERTGRKQVFDYYKDNFGSENVQEHNQQENTEENEEDMEGEQSSSLFTKSLFGRHPMFGGSKISSNFGTANKQSNDVSAYTEQQQRGVTNSGNNSGASFSLFELRKESKPVSTYSLFDNMAYRPSTSSQYDGGKQAKGIWSGKHFQEDDEEEEESEDNGEK